MEKNKISMILAIIASILGASGLGFGAYSVITSQVSEEQTINWNYDAYKNLSYAYPSSSQSVAYNESKEFHHIEFILNFKANLEVSFTGDVYSSSSGWMQFQFILDGKLGQSYAFGIDTVSTFISLGAMFYNVGPGHHRASIYFYNQGGGNPTYYMGFLAQISVWVIV